jgi:ABC-2 type transport system ATP-binding protein
MLRQLRWVGAAAVAAVLLLPSAALARDDTIGSFDGTTIVLHFFPAADLAPGAKAPTVLVGPGWSGAGATNPEAPTGASTGTVGLGPLRHAGYNVLTWDPRGFGTSGGEASVDSPDREGRDVQGLIDYVAAQPEALLDGVKDPRVGMAGGSYGGGIQLVTAGIDTRLDAIAPDIAWHSLETSLYQDRTFKSGWGTLLYLSGKARGRLDPHIDAAFQAGAQSGRLSSADAGWFRDRGPGDALVSKIRIPTLLLQGTVDTLFPLDEAVANFTQLRKTSTAPVQMIWFCGGHGTCNTPAGDPSLIETRTLAFFKRFLSRDTSVAAGPAFQWVDQNGTERDAAAYPPPALTPLRAAGSGTLALRPEGGSGPLPPTGNATADAAAVTGATKASNAVDVRVRAARTRSLVVGAPKVTLTYRGTAGDPDARLFGQVVDDHTGLVLGNLATPIPVRLDGRRHRVTRPLELVSATLSPGRSFTVQVVAASTAFAPSGATFNTGSVDLAKVAVSLPRLDPSKLHEAPGHPRVVRITRVAPKRIAVTVRSTEGTLRNVRISVRSTSGRVLGTARLSRLGAKRRTVQVRLTRRAPAKVRVLVKATLTG